MPFRPQRVGSVASSMAMFVLVSALAGVLIAGLFVPIAGLAGATSNAAAEELDNLPTEFETPPQSERSKVLLGNGDVLGYFYDENRIYVPLEKIAPVMLQAQLAIEDHRFYEHGALDLTGTLRALLKNSAGNATSGGSSITQQYVKMVEVEKCVQAGEDQDACVGNATTADGTEGYQRKIRELRNAIALEKKFSKDEILERYLNIAYYGEGAYGVQAAAKHYFSVSASKLTLAQAAMLAGLVQNPNSVNPVVDESAAIDRRDFVINQMSAQGMVTDAEVKEAKAVTFDQDKVKGTPNGCVSTRYPFLCDFVYRTLLKTESLGKTVEERENMIKRGGLTIQTAIDPKIQDKTQKAVSDAIDPRDPIIAAMNIIEPGTGLILASAQSRPVMGSDAKKGETYFNYSVSQDMGGAEGYQAGSTFKAFTAAAALEQGIPMSKTYNAKNRFDFTGMTFNSCNGPFQAPSYQPKNSTISGTMDMRRAMAMSVNTYFVQLEQPTGLCNVTKMLDRVGVDLADPELSFPDDYSDITSLTLGVAEVTPMSMAEAYATFAARGIHCDPIIIDKIETKDGKELAAPSANCERVMSKDVADAVSELLSGVMEGNNTGAPARLDDGRPQAGKTGTIDDNEAVWFAGYTPEVAGAAMIAVDKTRCPFKKSGCKNPRSNGIEYYRAKYSETLLQATGGGDAGAMIWKPAMTAATKGKPKTDFKAPPRDLQVGKQVQMPDIANLGVTAATEKLERAGFTVTTSRDYSDDVPEGEFIRWSPSGGTVAEFGTITAVYSDGRDPEKVAAEKKAEKLKKEREDEAEPEKPAEEDKGKGKDGGG